jgi:hypothetical protein
MTIFTAGAPNIVIPAKAGIHIYCLNRKDCRCTGRWAEPWARAKNK